MFKFQLKFERKRGRVRVEYELELTMDELLKLGMYQLIWDRHWRFKTPQHFANVPCACQEIACPPTLACVMCLCCFLHRRRRARFPPLWQIAVLSSLLHFPRISAVGGHPLSTYAEKTAQFCRQTVPKWWKRGDGGLKSCGSTKWKPPLSERCQNKQAAMHTPSLRQSKTLFDSAFCHRVHLWYSLHLEMYHPVHKAPGR